MNLKNKNNVIFLVTTVFLVTVIAAVVCILIAIWVPKKNVNEGIGYYSYTSYEKKLISIYQIRVMTLLNKSNVDSLVESLNSDFLTNNNLSKDNKEEIKKFLSANSLLAPGQATIIDYNISNNDNTGDVVIRFSYYNVNGEKKYVNLIESEPYSYTLSFEVNNKVKSQEGEPVGESSEEESTTNNVEYTSTSAKDRVTGEYEGIKFELTLVRSTAKDIKYNVKIENTSDYDVKFDFNNDASTQLYLSDNSKVKIAANAIKASDFYKLPPNSTLNHEVFFNIPLSKQGKIKSIVFLKVEINGEKNSIEVKF